MSRGMSRIAAVAMIAAMGAGVGPLAIELRDDPPLPPLPTSKRPRHRAKPCRVALAGEPMPKPQHAQTREMVRRAKQLARKALSSASPTIEGVGRG